MIKGISAMGKYVQVTNGNTSWPYVNYSGGLNVGQMRYNPNNQNIEVFDGNNWQQMMGSYASVQLNAEAESLLDWARDERNKQLKREALANKHPAVKKALEALQRAEEQVDIIVELSTNYENNKEVQASGY